MPALWVLGILALVVVLLLRTKIGLYAAVEGREVTLEARAGFLRFRVFPRPPRREKRRKPVRKKRPKKPEKPAEPFVRVTPALLWDLLTTMPPRLGRTARRIFRGIRVEPLTLSIWLGGLEDPAGAAETCGYALAALWTAGPFVERILTVPEPSIGIAVNFDAPETCAWGKIGVHFRLWTLLAAAVPTLSGLLAVYGRSGGKANKK